MTETKRALVSGVTGQDGSLLAELLLSKGYEVHGIVRRHAVPSYQNIEHIADKLHLHDGDLTDQTSLDFIAMNVKPHEAYSLAAQSHVGVSYLQPELTFDVTGQGAWRFIESIRRASPSCRAYQASSSEQFGNTITPNGMLNEDSPMNPVSPYGSAKLHAHKAASYYRQVHGMHVSAGILFNHEGPNRGPSFVTRKISIALARMSLGIPTHLRLGNLDAIRDWGYAPEYVEAMWRIVQLDEPQDLVIATGEGHSVEEFLDAALNYADLELPRDNPEARVTVDKSLVRPSDIHKLVGDATLASEVIKWTPKVRFAELVKIMMKADINRVARSVTK